MSKVSTRSWKWQRIYGLGDGLTHIVAYVASGILGFLTTDVCEKYTRARQRRIARYFRKRRRSIK